VCRFDENKNDMKTEIWVSFNYGGWSVYFSRTFELSFIPFIGLRLIFDDENEYDIKLDESDYCHTDIAYSLESNQFEIDVRHSWKHPVREDVIDETIERFKSWERKDSTDLNKLKELMLRNYNERINL
jgi:hypothetical protein